MPGRKPHKVLRGISISLLALLLLTVGAAVLMTFWLTPTRLSDIVATRASEYLNAEVRVHNLRFTIWSSFPRLVVESDSITIVSRSLDSAATKANGNLTKDYRRLMSLASFKGSMNVPAIFGGKVKLHDVTVSGLEMNLVALTDSCANWLIFPTTRERHPQIPDISADRILLRESRGITYRSIPTGLRICMRPPEASITHLQKRGTYRCRLGGDISVEYRQLQLLSKFPFSLDGDVTLRYNPLKVSFSDFGIALGNVQGNASLDLVAENDMLVNSFSFSLDTFKLLGLLGYVPGGIMPRLPEQKSGIPMRASARLTAPFHIGSESLPSLEITATIPQGDLELPLASNTPLRLSHSDISARLLFDGTNPADSRIFLSPVHLSTRGASMTVKAKIDNPGGSPLITTQLAIHSDLKSFAEGMRSLMPGFMALAPSGEVNADIKASFRLPDIQTPTPEDIRISAEMNVPGLKINTESSGHSGLAMGNAKVTAFCHAEMKDGTLAASSPTAYTLDVEKASWRSGNILLGATRLKARGNTSLFTPQSAFRSLAADITARSFSLTVPRHALQVAGIGISGNFSRRTEGTGRAACGYNPAQDKYLEADSMWLARTPHTPAFLAMHSQGMASFVKNWLLAADVKIDDASWKSDAYPHPFTLAKADLWCDFDSIAIRDLQFASGGSSLGLKGWVTGLRPFFMSHPCAPIRVNLTADAGVIDINQIARATHHPADTASARQKPHTTLAWLMPRNLTADLHLTGRQTLYTNLELDGLVSDFHLEKGRLRIPGLSLGTSFARLGVDVDFDTSDITKMQMDASLNVYDVDLEKMYGKLKSLTASFPQIKNLSGEAAAGGTVRFYIAPDMKVDMASLTAALNIEGRNLVLKQDPFIRHLTRMLLITNDRPIRISDFRVRVSVFDNLLELFPFQLDFGHYRIAAEGVNNFAGDLDYHLGVKRSPVPFPFGINIEGTYRHPEIRFGGAAWHPDNARRVTGHITKSFMWNFADKMKWAGNALLKKAATGQTL